MRSSETKGNASNGIDALFENGISHKDEVEARVIAEKVVQSVVERAQREAEHRSPCRPLPTIQIDAAPADSPLDEDQIELLIEDPQESPSELRESLRSYVEDIVSQAMGVVEKKLKFVGLDDDEEEEADHHEEEEAPPPEDEKRREEEEEIRAAAQKVVEEVIAQAQERMEKIEQTYPDLPSFQVDTVVSAPPSPEGEKAPDQAQKKKKWTFRMEEEGLPSFDRAPEDVKEVASNLVKDIVGKAIAIAEEKAVPTVPFSFEDVDLMKGPWYVRVREALLRVLRSACFCTPRGRNES